VKKKWFCKKKFIFNLFKIFNNNMIDIIIKY